jgi:hypothetical protein
MLAYHASWVSWMRPMGSEGLGQERGKERGEERRERESKTYETVF